MVSWGTSRRDGFWAVPRVLGQHVLMWWPLYLPWSAPWLCHQPSLPKPSSRVLTAHLSTAGHCGKEPVALEGHSLTGEKVWGWAHQRAGSSEGRAYPNCPHPKYFPMGREKDTKQG